MDTVSKIFGINPPKVAKSALQSTLVKPVNPTLVCGVELEIESCENSREWYVSQIGQKYWTVDTDGSLRPPETSFEFISKPLEQNALLGEMEKFFNLCKFGDANYSDRTSVHIHCNVTDYTQKQVASLAMVYQVFEDVLFQFVNHHKKKEEQGYCRDTNLYCIPWNQCRYNYSLVNNIFASLGSSFRNWQKYTALNLCPIITQGTVEWRHMHGTCDMGKLSQWINMIGAIMKFSKETEFEDVVKTLKVLNDTSAYQAFFDAVFQGTLGYSPEYATAMAEGVINAKYSLVNWETLKGKPPVKKPIAEVLAEARRDADVVARAEADAAALERWRVDFDRREAELRATIAQRADDRARPQAGPALRARTTRLRTAAANTAATVAAAPGGWFNLNNEPVARPQAEPAPLRWNTGTGILADDLWDLDPGHNNG